MPSGAPNPDTLKPLSNHARATLKAMVRNGSTPRYMINPGVSYRLMRGGLIEQDGQTWRPTPDGVRAVELL